MAFYINVESDKLLDFKILQPGAYHFPRFMADSLYIPTLEMISAIIDFVLNSRKLFLPVAVQQSVVYGIYICI